MATNILNFHNKKRASRYLQPFQIFSSSNTGLNFTKILDNFQKSWSRFIKLSTYKYSQRSEQRKIQEVGFLSTIENLRDRGLKVNFFTFFIKILNLDGFWLIVKGMYKCGALPSALLGAFPVAATGQAFLCIIKVNLSKVPLKA